MNPFPEYRPQTVYEFLYCRISELFHERPRGGVPFNEEAIRKQLPSRQPDFELLQQTSSDYAKHVNSNADGSVTLVEPSTNSTPSEKKAEEGDNIDSHAVDFGKDFLLLPAVKDRLTLTWLGQSCAFLQMGGLNILTDPCFGKHLFSPYVGPKRISPPPCQLEDLPKVDLVLVSHDHPDHLELETASAIGNSAVWVVPVGVGRHLESVGISKSNFHEMSWWEKIPLPGTDPREGWEVACTPAMHWSGRTMVDANSTLWCSFVVLRNGKPVFFHAGDTGYSYPLFEGIKRVFGSGYAVAMVPCGAYTPRWHLRSQHTNPQEAIQIMKDLGARKLVGVHWGTFVLSEEHFLEPRDLLHSLAEKERRGQDIIAPEFGRTLVFRVSGEDGEDENGGERESEVRVIRDGKALLFD